MSSSSYYLKFSGTLAACGAVGFVVALKIGEDTITDLPADFMSDFVTFTRRYEAWLWSVVASILIGLAGIFPLIVIPTEGAAGPSSLPHGVCPRTLRLLLCFAVGSLLGDVFLHLLPEAWHLMEKSKSGGSHISIGAWVLAGLFSFIILEVLFSKESVDEQETARVTHMEESSPVLPVANGGASHRRHVRNGGSNVNHKTNLQNGHAVHTNGYANGHCKAEPNATNNTKHITGYLNLLANCIDNFTHGLSVAGSFLVSSKVGWLTTFAILVHEVPHEIGDFAILLKSGFNRWEAAKAQVLTASVGLLGAVTALTVDSGQTLGHRTTWILPFTAGGFLNIALVSVLPDLLKENTSRRESFKQLLCLFAGVAVMGVVTVFCE